MQRCCQEKQNVTVLIFIFKINGSTSRLKGQAQAKIIKKSIILF